MPDIVEIFRELPLFEPLDDAVVEELARQSIEEDLEQGRVLFKLGQPGDALFVLMRGELKFFIDGPDGQEITLSLVEPGDVIGEIVILEPGPRTAGAMATQASTVRRLSQKNFLRIVEEKAPDAIPRLQEITARMRDYHLSSTLRTTELFRKVSPETVQMLVKRLQSRHLNKDEVLFRKGEPGNELFIISQGWLKIVSQGSGPEELLLNQCGPGTTIGEMSLLDDIGRSAGAVAMTDAEVLVLERDDFIDVLNENESTLFEVIKNVSGRLRLATTYIEQFGSWSTQLAAGNYDYVMNQIKSEQDKHALASDSDRERVNRYLSTFFSSVEAIKEREENLKREVRRLKIEIDEAKRKQEYETITSTDFFSSLRDNVEKLRAELRAEGGSEASPGGEAKTP